MSSVTYAHPDVHVKVKTPGVSLTTHEVYQRFREIEAASLTVDPLAGIDDVVEAARYVAKVSEPTMSQERLYLGPSYTALGLEDGRTFDLEEGRTFRLVVSPGTAGVTCHDAARRDRALERIAAARTTTASMLALYDNGDGSDLDIHDVKRGRAVTNWSKKSRARMFRTIPTLDLSEWSVADGDLGMLTLTLPGDWEVLTPTGSHFKACIDAFRKRWVRAGLVWKGLWKLEFQRRGAPHLHALMRLPRLVNEERFDTWVARQWAEVCGSDDTLCHACGIVSCLCVEPDTERRRHLAAGVGIDLSGSKYTDPRRIATYFLGHSSKHTDGKEYQHIVPELWQGEGAGPGRFWGYWGLDRGIVQVDLDQREWYAVRRMLRKIARARAWYQTQQAAKYGKTIVRRPLRSLGHRGGMGGGTVVVNDGVRLAYDLGHALSVRSSTDLDGERYAARQRRLTSTIID